MSTSGKIPGIVSKFVFLLRILALSVTFRSFLTCHSGWIHALSTLSKLHIREQCVCWMTFAFWQELTFVHKMGLCLDLSPDELKNYALKSGN